MRIKISKFEAQIAGNSELLAISVTKKQDILNLFHLAMNQL
jgi:hypothetical protein